jgi:hypothetical protein
LPIADPRSTLPLARRKQIALAARATLDQVTAALCRLPENKGRGAGRKRNAAKGRSKTFVESAAVASWLCNIAQQEELDASVASALTEVARSVLRGDVEAGRLPFFGVLSEHRRQVGDHVTGDRKSVDSHSIITAAEAPESVRRLLKSYSPNALRWAIPEERYEVVVAVLLRGEPAARAWLDTMLGEADLRGLVAEFRGAGCAEPDRQRLREQLGLTTAEIPRRPYLGFTMGGRRA